MLHKMVSLQDVQQTYRWFEEMRETQPVWRDEESGFWHVFRYQDVYRVTTDYSMFSSEVRPRPAPRKEDGTRPFGRSLIAMDPPQHRKYRDLISPSFTPHALARLSGRIATITQELLDEVKPKGHMDLATDLAYPLAGAIIFAWLASANRDGEQFPEPERFDITRNPNKHLAFGHGIHFCVGAPLSRLETSIALPMILAQLPELRREPGQSGTLFEGRALFGYRHLPVVFTPAKAA